MKLDEKFLKKHNIIEYECLDKFKSKKNDVRKIKIIKDDKKEETVVVKHFENKAGFEKEKKFLDLAIKKNIDVPNVLYYKDNTIISEYIKGELLLSSLFKDKEQIVLLSNTLKDIYKKFNDENNNIYNNKNLIILGDMNLRNFIFSKENKKIYRIDFESIEYGKIEKDLGRLCAFCMSYDPCFTSEKIKVTKELFYYLLKILKISKETFKEEIILELSKIEKRRNISVSKDILQLIKQW